MSTTEAAPRPAAARAAASWPRWTTGALLASGLIIVVAETTSWLFFVGVALAGVGGYGLADGLRAVPPR